MNIKQRVAEWRARADQYDAELEYRVASAFRECADVLASELEGYAIVPKPDDGGYVNVRDGATEFYYTDGDKARECYEAMLAESEKGDE